MVLFWCVWLFLMENFRNLVTPSNDKAYEITAICESFHKCPLEFHIFETRHEFSNTFVYQDLSTQTAPNYDVSSSVMNMLLMNK